MSEERFEDWLKENAQSYHRPPADVPRDEMWDAIAHARQARTAKMAGAPGGRFSPVHYAIAASLLIGAGIGLGYWMRGPAAEPGAPVVATHPADSVITNTTYEVASVAHLSAVESMLTSFRATAPAESDRAMQRLARDLLATTRLLMDTPAAENASRRQLLEDLEYVLMQIVQLDPNAPAEDRALVDRAIAREQMLTRIRSSIPAGFSSGN